MMNMPKTRPASDAQAPSHLSPESRDWWRAVVADFELDASDLRLLRLAAECWDRLQAARAVLDAEGVSYVDRFGAPRSRPEVAVERDGRIAFARLVRELALGDDIEPPESRPPRVARRGYSHA